MLHTTIGGAQTTEAKTQVQNMWPENHTQIFKTIENIVTSSFVLCRPAATVGGARIWS